MLTPLNPLFYTPNTDTLHPTLRHEKAHLNQMRLGYYRLPDLTSLVPFESVFYVVYCNSEFFCDGSISLDYRSRLVYLEGCTIIQLRHR